MKTVMLAAALCAAFSMAAPAAHAAATVMSKGPTDVQIYCSLAPWAAKCKPGAASAKPVASVRPARHKPMKIAMAKPAAAKSAPVGIKTMACAPAAKGKPYLYDCHWK